MTSEAAQTSASPHVGFGNPLDTGNVTEAV